MRKDLHELPKIRDSISYLYFEHAIIEQDDSSIVIINDEGKTPVPVASCTCLMLGPGTSITHAAIRACGENGCMIIWCGEGIQRFYASGIGETRSAANQLRQAKLCMDGKTHLEVAKRMYEVRFPQLPKQDYSLQQLRGMEGIRVREAYKLASKLSGVLWQSRQYKNTAWEASDPINRALSESNAILYGLCHAAIVSLGYSPALGFIHTGKMLSFVYDIADLYKAETTIPAAFESLRNSDILDSSWLRRCCRSRFQQARLLERIADDIKWIFDIEGIEDIEAKETGDLWDEEENVQGGKNYSVDVLK
ncbi:MAG TPA: type I-E CRISPR-associated endonuclease Cas1 [Acholeplasmatales bacterium]|nr:type I-E CRISPR-associated endonuclease Cas1 [Acholeplasmatales bacterium]